jgi:hypothetical protein
MSVPVTDLLNTLSQLSRRTSFRCRRGETTRYYQAASLSCFLRIRSANFDSILVSVILLLVGVCSGHYPNSFDRIMVVEGPRSIPGIKAQTVNASATLINERTKPMLASQMMRWRLMRDSFRPKSPCGVLERPDTIMGRLPQRSSRPIGRSDTSRNRCGKL